jgi:hypothetical protein
MTAPRRLVGSILIGHAVSQAFKGRPPNSFRVPSVWFQFELMFLYPAIPYVSLAAIDQWMVRQISIQDEKQVDKMIRL